MNNVVKLASVSVLALIAGCATSGRAGPQRYSGEYFYNFEFAYLTPQGKSEEWCLSGDMSKAELPEGWGTSQVVVEGTLGPRGKYGNLGACERVLTVTRLVEVSDRRGRE